MANSETQIKVKGFLSYPSLFTPRSFDENGEKKYQTNVLIPKSDIETINRIEQALVAAATSNPKQKASKKASRPWHDGADDADAEEGTEWLADYMVLGTLKSKVKHWVDPKLRLPKVFIRRDGAVRPATEGDVFGGAEAEVVLNFYVTTGYDRINGGLNGVLLTGGVAPFGRLGGAASVTEMFGEIDLSGMEPVEAEAEGANDFSV